MSVRVRFAPAPTGDLHIGGAMVAVANHLLRLQQGGAFVLRIVQMIHPPSTLLTATSYLPGDLLGSYGVNSLVSGANPLWSYGVMNVDAAGQAGFSSYLNSNSVLHSN